MQRRDLRGLIPRLSQHLIGVFSEGGAGSTRGLGRRTAQLEGRSEEPDGPLSSRLDQLDNHLPRAHEVRGQRLVEIEHRLQAAVVLGGKLLPLGARARGEDLTDGAMRLRARRIEGVVDEILAVYAPAELGPELRLERAQRHVAVGATVGPVAGDAAVDEARVLLTEAFVANPEPVEHAWAKRFEEHIRFAGQAEQDLLAALVLQVDPDRALSSIQS